MNIYNSYSINSEPYVDSGSDSDYCIKSSDSINYEMDNFFNGTGNGDDSHPIPRKIQLKRVYSFNRQPSLSELEANLHKQISYKLPPSTSQLETREENKKTDYIQNFYLLLITPCYCVSSIPGFRSCFQFMTKDFETIETSLNNLMENADSKLTITQRCLIYTKNAFEIYRTIISSLLVVFVPQKCGENLCSLFENIIPDSSLEYVAISFNFILAIYFYFLYLIELKREYIIEKKLFYDREMPTDKRHLEKMLNSMNSSTKKKVMDINLVYRGFGRFLILVFLLNIFLSGVVVYHNFLNNTTLITYTTNSLFMVTKIFRVLRITSSGDYIIYSAYRNDNLIYNRDKAAFLTDIDVGEIDTDNIDMDSINMEMRNIKMDNIDVYIDVYS